MDTDSQIFFQLEPNKEPVEYLLDRQALNMIKGNHVTKDEIKDVVETGSTYIVDEYGKAYRDLSLSLVITITVRIDPVLRIVDNVEKHIF